MNKTLIVLCTMAITFASNAQIIREQTTPQTIGSQIPGYSQVSSINTVTVSYTPPTPLSQPTPIDGDTTSFQQRLPTSLCRAGDVALLD